MSDTTQAVSPKTVAGARQRNRRLNGGASMARHGRLGQVRVDPRTGRTTLDGEILAAPPAASVPLSRLFFL